jgi:hypothetical protein
MHNHTIKKTSILEKVAFWIIRNWAISLLIVLGGITNLGLIIFSGSEYCINNECGMYIGGLHYHDSLWHLALANSAFQKIPFQLPIFAGAPLQGYNYFLDLIIFFLTGIGIPAVVSYFKFIPIIFYVIFAYLSYLYAKKINKSQIFIVCSLFFAFFGSSFTYILSLYHFKSLSSFFYAQAMQSGRMLLNLQYAVSLLPFLGVLILLKKDKLHIMHIASVGFLLFLTIGLKLYGGVILLFLIAMDFFLRFWKDKKYLRWLINFCIVFFLFMFAIILFYDPFTASKSGAAFIYSPFALTRPMIEAADHFYLPNLVHARYFLQSVNTYSPRLLAIELLGVFLFIFLNGGTRLIGFIYIFQSILRKKITKDEIVLLSTIIFSTLLTVTLVQKGTWWNVIQFYGYTLFLMNYFASIFLYKLFTTKKVIVFIFGIMVILFTLPTNVEQITLAFERQITIPNIELRALERLKKLPDGIVMALPTQDTAYISAFSGKQQFLADEGVLTIVGIKPEKRIDELKNMNLYDLSPKIHYLYIKKNDYKENVTINGFHTVFENSEVIIKSRN